MSTTPRTDAARGIYGHDAAVSADTAAQLETELTACATRLAEVERERDEQRDKVCPLDLCGVAEKLEPKLATLAAENARLKAGLKSFGSERQFAGGLCFCDTAVRTFCVGQPKCKEINALIDTANPSPVPASGNEAMEFRKVLEQDFCGLLNNVQIDYFCRLHEVELNAALRERDELKRRVEELENSGRSNDQIVAAFEAAIAKEYSVIDPETEGNGRSGDLLDDFAEWIEHHAKLEGQRNDEKKRRIYYQDIVYKICNIVDSIDGKKPGTGVVCGTVDSPSTELQDRITTLKSEIVSKDAIWVRGQCVAIGTPEKYGQPRIEIHTTEEEIIKYQKAVNGGLFLREVEVRLVSPTAPKEDGKV